MIKFYTFRKDALAHMLRGQVLKFTKGKGYWLFGSPKPIIMYDSINILEIPPDAEAVAGYVGGMWPTFPTLLLEWPKAHKLSIAVASYQDADCLDVEQGDASPDQAPKWIRRQHSRGIKKPVVYTSVSQAQRLMEKLARAGIPRSAYRLWTAHYTFKPHRCSKKCGFGMTGVADATQYSDHALGRNLDASLCEPTFFG